MPVPEQLTLADESEDFRACVDRWGADWIAG